MTTIYLLRTAEHYGTKHNVFLGTTDMPIFDNGLKQAKEIAYYFQNIHLDRVYCSDLVRARSTIIPLLHQYEVIGETAPEVIYTEELRDINGGKWNATAFEEIIASYPNTYSCWKNDFGNTILPNGESVFSCDRRISTFFKSVLEKNKDKTIIICSHATPIRLLQGQIQNRSLPLMDTVKWAPYASISKFTYHNESKTFTIDFLNQTSHLTSTKKSYFGAQIL